MTAREYEWHRSFSYNNGYAYHDAALIEFVPEGWTLMKTRFFVQMRDRLTPSYGLEIGNPTMWGVAMAPYLDPSPNPILDLDHKWILWEPVFTTYTTMPLIYPNYSIATGPQPLGARESDSRRVVPAGGANMWFTFDAWDSFDQPDQTRYYQWEYGAEFLWLKPLA